MSRIERDPEDPSRVHVTMPDPRPTAAELAEIRAVARAVIAGLTRYQDETIASFRERVRAAVRAAIDGDL